MGIKGLAASPSRSLGALQSLPFVRFECQVIAMQKPEVLKSKDTLILAFL